MMWEKVPAELDCFYLEKGEEGDLAALCSIQWEGVGTAETYAF